MITKVWILAALLCLLTVADAELDSVIVGDYRVSFDMGLPISSYTKDTQVKSDGTSLLHIISDANPNTEMVTISIKPEDISGMTGKGMEAMARATLESNGATRIYSGSRTIDGREAGTASGDMQVGVTKIRTTVTVYYPDNSTEAVIVSSYPLEEGTGDLLWTLHIVHAPSPAPHSSGW